MVETPLAGKTILITGAARRIGRALALACARSGADVIVHYHGSQADALQLQNQILKTDRRAWILQADLQQPDQALRLVEQAASLAPLFALVNNASIFAPLSIQETALADWDRHLAVNLTAPFLLSKAFAAQVPAGGTGCIVSLLDWRALRPGPDHVPYTISKSALAALTLSMARAFAPAITVNGLALGAILPPVDTERNDAIIEAVPARRWGGVDDVSGALLFLLTEGAYITGEIIHVDGGRHLV
jgi:pteridine reductase